MKVRVAFALRVLIPEMHFLLLLGHHKVFLHRQHIQVRKCYKPPASQKYTMPSSIEKMIPEDQENIHQALARTIYASG